MGTILIVDDEDGVRGMLAVVLRRDGHRILCADSGEAALQQIAADPGIELVLTDLRMEPMDGLALLRALRERHTDAFTVMMTAFAEWDTAVTAMQLGAYDLLRKPFDTNGVRALVGRALAGRDRWLAARQAGGHPPATHLVGSSPGILAVQALIEQVSATDSTVLISGEVGTGKELVARALHFGGLRADGPLMRLDCVALDAAPLDSELFGHVRGAFPGAIEDRPSLLALAQHGTLFIDEVADLHAEAQTRLLRVLDNGEYTPIGGREPRRCDVRIVASTSRDLAALVREGSFREDLAWRLRTIPIALPPLRERREDIPLLAGHLLARHAVKLRRGVNGFTRDALAALIAHPWPGNARELDQRIQRGVALTTTGPIPVEHLFADGGSQASDDQGPAALIRRLDQGQAIDLESELIRHERALMEAALRRSGDNLTEAAKLLGISFRQIRYRVRQLGLR